MRIAICDDEAGFIASFSELIKPMLTQEDSFTSYKGGLGFLDDNASAPYDLIFLDVDMPGLSGLDVGNELQNMYTKTYVVFVTKHPGFALEAFNVRALHYLVKPVDRDKLRYCIEEVRRRVNVNNKESFPLSTKQAIQYIPLNEIIYLESFWPNLHVQTFSQTLIGRHSLKDAENYLKDKGFYRIHKSYIVNLQNVQIVRKPSRQIEMTNSRILPIGKNRDINDFLCALTSIRGGW